MTRRKVVYNGTDPNLKGMKCEVIRKRGDRYTLVASDEILGKVVFEVHKTQVR